MNQKGAITSTIVVIIIVLLFITILAVKSTGRTVYGENRTNDLLPQKISELKLLNLQNVSKYEDYKIFADNVNDGISIINEQTGAEISSLETTEEAWSRMSKVIVKYSPLINNYNSLVNASKVYQANPSEGNYRYFYHEASVFSLEFAFISATLVHTVTFSLVGKVATSLGIGRLALECPSCASAIMSSAYWTIKTTLVEEASKGADNIFGQLNETIMKRS